MTNKQIQDCRAKYHCDKPVTLLSMSYVMFLFNAMYNLIEHNAQKRIPQKSEEESEADYLDWCDVDLKKTQTLSTLSITFIAHVVQMIYTREAIMYGTNETIHTLIQRTLYIWYKEMVLIYEINEKDHKKRLDMRRTEFLMRSMQLPDYTQKEEINVLIPRRSVHPRSI